MRLVITQKFNMSMEAWSLLTPEEQAVLSSKLAAVEGVSETDGTRQDIYRDAFNKIIGIATGQETQNMVTLVRNFIDTAGGRSNNEIWREIKTFNGVWLGHDFDGARNDPRFHEGGGVIFTVNDKTSFLDTLKKNGYAINTFYDRLFNKRTHPNDSAREITDTSLGAGAHMANDNPDNIDLFYLHWDKRSTEFRKGKWYSRWLERLEAGKSHDEPFTASEVREKLRQRGVVPENQA